MEIIEGQFILIGWIIAKILVTGFILSGIVKSISWKEIRSLVGPYFGAPIMILMVVLPIVAIPAFLLIRKIYKGFKEVYND